MDAEGGGPGGPRWSARSGIELRPNALATAATRARAVGRPLLDLTVGNPTEVGFTLPRLLLPALSRRGVVRYEPHAFGLPAARAQVSAHLAARGSEVPPARVVLTASTSEAYGFLFKLLCDPGDEVLVPVPGYPLLDHLARLEQVRLVPYRLAYDGRWHVAHETVEAGLSPRTRAIVLVHPNNPTGSFVSRADLARLERVAAARRLAIVSDEVFADYAFDAGDPAEPRAGSVSGLRDALGFALGGLSKAAALPQLKLGWMAVAGPEALVTEALARLEVIADTFLSVGAPVQHALPVLLGRSRVVAARILRRVQHNRALLREAVRNTAASLLGAEGGWYAVLRLPRTRSDEAWALELLDAEGVLVQPGYLFDFDGEGHVVVSLLPRPAVFARGVERLLARVARD